MLQLDSGDQMPQLVDAHLQKGLYVDGSKSFPFFFYLFFTFL